MAIPQIQLESAQEHALAVVKLWCYKEIPCLIPTANYCTECILTVLHPLTEDPELNGLIYYFHECNFNTTLFYLSYIWTCVKLYNTVKQIKVSEYIGTGYTH